MCARAEAGMLGVNVGVAAPMAFFPFNGVKNSFYGDLHATGKDGVRFFTENKVRDLTLALRAGGRSRRQAS